MFQKLRLVLLKSFRESDLW